MEVWSRQTYLKVNLPYITDLGNYEMKGTILGIPGFPIEN